MLAVTRFWRNIYCVGAKALKALEFAVTTFVYRNLGLSSASNFVELDHAEVLLLPRILNN